jgi:hypothetical protein
MGKDDPRSKALVAAESRPPATAEAFGRTILMRKLVADAGDKAARHYANSFGSIDNNSRAAYARACASFLASCHAKGIANLRRGRAIHVGAYLNAIGGTHEKPTGKQCLGWAAPSK